MGRSACWIFDAYLERRWHLHLHGSKAPHPTSPFIFSGVGARFLPSALNIVVFIKILQPFRAKKIKKEQIDKTLIASELLTYR